MSSAQGNQITPAKESTDFFCFKQMQSWTFWTSVLIVNCDISALSLADCELKTVFLQQKHLSPRRTNLPDWIAKLLFIKDRSVDKISTTQEGFFSNSCSLNRRNGFSTEIFSEINCLCNFKLKSFHGIFFYLEISDRRYTLGYLPILADQKPIF